MGYWSKPGNIGDADDGKQGNEHHKNDDSSENSLLTRFTKKLYSLDKNPHIVH